MLIVVDDEMENIGDAQHLLPTRTTQVERQVLRSSQMVDSCGLRARRADAGRDKSACWAQVEQVDLLGFLGAHLAQSHPLVSVLVLLLVAFNFHLLHLSHIN